MTTATARLRGVRHELASSPKVMLVVYAILTLAALAVVFGPLVAPADVNVSDIEAALKPPSAAHWLGTDAQGRDVLWRTVIGARESVVSAVLIVIGFSVLGVLVAVVATGGGRRVDETVMRVVDSVMAMPPILFALGVAAALGPSLRSAIIAMVLTGWPYTARLLRGIMRVTAESTFVESARVLGAGTPRVMLRHILPNSLDVMVVKWAGDMGNTILVLGALSFVGVGAQPPSAEWGAAITAAKGDMATAWWAALAPGVAIAVTAVAFGLLGDSLQRRFNADLA